MHLNVTCSSTNTFQLEEFWRKIVCRTFLSAHGRLELHADTKRAEDAGNLRTLECMLTQRRASLSEQSIRHCINTPALRAISRAAEFLGAAAGRRMHLVPRGHELFLKHLNPNKAQHYASVQQFASSTLFAR